MACARLAAALAAALAVALPAASAHAAAPPAAPQNLHAFSLRADEAVAHTFARTPSFAWNPVAGAKSYEFELSTSRRFSDNGIVWSGKGIKSPATALPLTLPWISGSPYSLYGHVRALTAKGVSAWSAPFGFNMRWPAVPTPLSPSYPGLLRWSTVPGASGYMVWLVDAGHWFTTRSNMADEREYYDFHNSAAWTGVVHWRVRPMRWLYGAADNALPEVSYGPWSPVYTSYNPPFSPGPMQTMATVSNAGVADATTHGDAQHHPRLRVQRQHLDLGHDVGALPRRSSSPTRTASTRSSGGRWSAARPTFRVRSARSPCPST